MVKRDFLGHKCAAIKSSLKNHRAGSCAETCDPGSVNQILELVVLRSHDLMLTILTRLLMAGFTEQSGSEGASN